MGGCYGLPMALPTTTTAAQQKQQKQLEDQLWLAMEAGDGLPLVLVLDAVLMLTASVALNAGMTARQAAYSLLQRMKLLQDTTAPVVVTQAVQVDPAVPLAGWVGCPPGDC